MSKYLKTTFLIISILCNLIFIYLLKRPAFLVNAGYIDNDNVKIADVNTAMVQMPTPSKSIITTPIPTLAEIPIITPISTQPEAPIIAAIEKDSETQIDRWVSQSNERLDQLFYGTWDIVDLVSTELGLPSSYSGFREDGSFRGPDFSKIIGKEIKEVCSGRWPVWFYDPDEKRLIA